MRLNLLEFAELSKEYQGPSLWPDPIVNENSAAALPSAGTGPNGRCLECPWLSWYKVDTSGPTLTRVWTRLSSVVLPGDALWAPDSFVRDPYRHAGHAGRAGQLQRVRDLRGRVGNKARRSWPRRHRLLPHSPHHL